MSDEARHYGKFARHLFELSREDGEESVMLFLESMSDIEIKTLMLYLIRAGGYL